MKQEHKNWIDSASHETLLRRNRFGPLGDEIFLDDTGECYPHSSDICKQENRLDAMAAKKQNITSAEAAQISKKIGWK